MVSELLLQQEYEKRGIRVTDQEIIDAARFSPPPQFYSTPELQTDGRFDPVKYERFLQSLRKAPSLGVDLVFSSDLPRAAGFDLSRLRVVVVEASDLHLILSHR